MEIILTIFKSIVLIIFGLSIGTIVAGGVSALITAIGVVTRIAFRTETTDRVMVYEYCVLFGASLANIIYIYNLNAGLNITLGYFIISIIGLFMGIFVGCIAMSLAEALDVSTIFFRRLKLKKYLGIVIIAAALGKFMGNILYFIT